MPDCAVARGGVGRVLRTGLQPLTFLKLPYYDSFYMIPYILLIRSSIFSQDTIRYTFICYFSSHNLLFRTVATTITHTWCLIHS
jgi:hypothetical protein